MTCQRGGVTDLIDRVELERRLRGWSVREAGAQGGISNTTWASFEATGMVTPKVRIAIAKAFGWPSSWPEELPEPPVIFQGEPPVSPNDVSQLRGRVDSMESELDRLRSQVVALAQQVERQGHRMDEMTDDDEERASDRASAGRGRRPTQSDR